MARTVAATVPMEQSYPWVPWPTVRHTLNGMWDPENTPHHSVIGLTGSGKSFLVCNGLLSMCNYGRVLLIDTKGDDAVLNSCGAKPVAEIPQRTWYQSLAHNPRRERREHWYRLVVDDDPVKGRLQVYRALKRIYETDGGNWVLVLDEIRDLTDPKPPNFNLAPYIDRIYRKGRNKHLPIIAGTQSPAWVPRTFYDQASFAWIGRLRDEQRQKRLLEIGGMNKDAFPVVASLQRREWLLSADNGEYFARTQVTVGGR